MVLILLQFLKVMAMANDVVQVQIVGSVAGEPAECVLHFQYDGTAGNTPTPSVTALVNVLASSFNAIWLAALPDDYQLVGYKAKRVNNTGGPSSAKPTPGAVGTRGATSISSGQGPVIIWNYLDLAADPDRWRTGRTFLPGISEGDLAGNVILPALTTATQAVITFLVAGFVDGDTHHWDFVLWSRKNSIAIMPNSGTVSGVIGTQRRRLHPAL